MEDKVSEWRLEVGYEGIWMKLLMGDKAGQRNKLNKIK